MTTTMKLDGIELEYDDGGTGEPALVLLHGYTGSLADWAEVAPALRTRRRVVCLSHRGHGASTNTGDPASYTFDALVDDFGRFVDGLGLSTFDLLGHSMGGVISMRYVLDHPTRVRSLILMDTGAEPAGSMPLDYIKPLVERGRAEGMAAVYDSLAPIFEAGLQQIRDTDPDRADVMASRGRTKFAQLDPEAFAAFASELDHYPSMVGRLHEIRCPTTVIVGELDGGLRGAADVLATSIPDARLVVIDGAGHNPQVDAPNAWLGAIEDHFAVG
jgi:pimeloyl-ACP methyl ester carboxylesterase